MSAEKSTTKKKLIGIRADQELLDALNRSCNDAYAPRTLPNKVKYLVKMALGICPATDEVADNIVRCLREDGHKMIKDEEIIGRTEALRETVRELVEEEMQPLQRRPLRLVK